MLAEYPKEERVEEIVKEAVTLVPAGEDGFLPTIAENPDNTADVYRLDITDKNGSHTTPNLKGADGDGSEALGGLTFAQDSEGKWGYIPPGADAVVPFSKTPDGLRNISLIASPANGGSVSGGGMATDGMAVTVNAEPDGGSNFLFDGWKEGGAVVNAEPLYTFIVSADRNLVALFAEVQYVAGADWWKTALPSSANWWSVTYGNGKFVVVTYGSNKEAYSADGITWTAATLPSSASWYSVTYGNGKFVAVAYNSNKAAYSADGITWTAATLPSSASWYSVTYGNGKFVAVAFTNSDKAAYSADGITWTAATLPSSANWVSVTCGNEKFVVVAHNSDKAAYSSAKGPGK